MKKIPLTIMAAAMLLTTISCATTVAGAELKSNKDYDASPSASDAILQSLADGNTEFALDLYQQLKEDEDSNLFY